MKNNIKRSLREIMCRIVRPDPVLPAVLLGAFAYFFAGGYYIQSLLPQNVPVVELLGFDYTTYLKQFLSTDSILHFPFRHPLYGVFLSPIILVSSACFGSSTGNALPTFLCAVFSGVVALSVGISYKIQRDVLRLSPLEASVGCLLFSSFAYMPILSAGPESFAVSMLILLATLYVGAQQLVLRRPQPSRNWLLLALLAGGITITNAVKVGLAYVASNRMNHRTLRQVTAACLILFVVGFLGYAARMAHYNATHSGPHKSISQAIEQTCVWIRTDIPLRERANLAMARFFSEPILSHDHTLRCHNIPLQYTSKSPLLLLAALYTLVLASLVSLIRTDFTRLLLALFAVDAVLHFVLSWGIQEGQLFCGHWFYLLPLFTAQLISRCSKPPVRLALCGILVLIAIGNFAHNWGLLKNAVY